MTNETTGIYHWRDYWFFKRGADGTVVIRRQTPGEVVGPELFIPPNEWASIIAHVSARGENAETYEEATTFHSAQEAPHA